MKNAFINISLDGIHFFAFYMGIIKHNDNFLNIALFMAWVHSALCLVSSFADRKEWSKRVEDTGKFMTVYHAVIFTVILLILAYMGFFVTAGCYLASYTFYKTNRKLAIEMRDKPETKND